MEKKYFKVVNSVNGNYGLFYHEGINTDPLPFNPYGDCEKGGLYFASEDIFTFFGMGDTVYEVKPIGEVYENPDTPKKWKAHSLDMKLIGKTNDIKTIKYLIDNGIDIHKRDDYALQWAAFYGYFYMVKYLVEHGANIHAENDVALQWAAYYGNFDIVKYLVEHGANIHAENDVALRYAAENGYLDVVKYLVEHGADIHAGDDDAFKNGSKEIVEYLQNLTK